jgi:hypothetical protein
VLRNVGVGDQVYPGTDEIYTFRSKDMDKYAETYGILADRIWEEEYLKLASQDRLARSRREMLVI